MAAADDMNDHENWTGGLYELSLVLGPAEDRMLDQARAIPMSRRRCPGVLGGLRTA